MSVVIKDVEMPRSCENCKLLREVFNFTSEDFDYFCQVTESSIDRDIHNDRLGVKLDDCPLVEVDACRTYGANTEQSTVYVERETVADIFDMDSKSRSTKTMFFKLKNRLKTDLHEYGIGVLIFNWILVILFFALISGLALLVILILIHWIRFGFVPIIHLS